MLDDPQNAPISACNEIEIAGVEVHGAHADGEDLVIWIPLSTVRDGLNHEYPVRHSLIPPAVHASILSLWNLWVIAYSGEMRFAVCPSG